MYFVTYVNNLKNEYLFIIYRVTKPGGYVEILDIYFTLRGAGPILSKIYEARK
jgi:hypothetical protein